MFNKISIFSFFSGIGFLDLGFENAGYDIELVNEFHGPFLEGYKHARKKIKKRKPQYGYSNADIKNYLEPKNIRSLKEQKKELKKQGRVVGFIGGPPCPDFSVGGKNRGKNGKNGILSAIYAELISETKPDFFLFENVKGLLRTKKHRAFYEEIKRRLAKANFFFTERLINAIEFGAPQDRDRIILIGFQKNLISSLGVTKKQLGNGFFPWKKYIKYNLSDIKSYNWPTTDVFKENKKIPCPDDIISALTVEHWFEKNAVGSHFNANHHFTPRAGLVKMLKIAEGDDSKKSYKRLHRWRYSPTVAYGNNEVHLHPYKARRLTISEALSLQSMPPSFELPESMSLTNMFKSVGNGVPYLASNAIAKTIKSFLQGVKAHV